MKLLQLNIFQGKYIQEIIDFVHNNHIDILNFQEVTGGKMSRGGRSNYSKDIKFILKPINQNSLGIDCIEKITSELNYQHEFLKTMSYKSDKNSYHGIATFQKPNIHTLSTKILYTYSFTEIEDEFNDWRKVGRGAIINMFRIKRKPFYVVNTHLAWGPNPEDEDYKIKQAGKLLKELKILEGPIILTGDFNVIPSTKTASMFEDIGFNLVKLNDITNTLNPDVHGSEQLFPKGIAVDYIFVSSEIKVNEFKLIDKPDLSDHYGLFLDFDIT